MPNYRIARLDLDSKWRDQIGRVVGEAFNLGSPPSTVVDQILVTTNSRVDRGSLYLGAIEGTELVGFNAFIAHELEFQRAPVVAFQSEWSATKTPHRGKRVFQNLIREAHRELALQGASFVFGFPNQHSEPLLVGKLGYRREPSVKRNIPGPWAESFFSEQIATPVGIAQNDDQLIRIKRAIYGEHVFVEGGGGRFALGRSEITTYKAGRGSLLQGRGHSLVEAGWRQRPGEDNAQALASRCLLASHQRTTQLDQSIDRKVRSGPHRSTSLVPTGW